MRENILFVREKSGYFFSGKKLPPWLSRSTKSHRNVISCVLQNSESGKDDGEENGNEPLEAQLRKKMEASQRKLAELQEHQANLVGMQLQVRERLNAARQAQQALLQQENQAQAAVAPATPSSAWETSSRGSQPAQAETDEIDSETALLRNKLAILKTKKRHMDQLMVELQHVELSDRASVVSSRFDNFFLTSLRILSKHSQLI